MSPSRFSTLLLSIFLGSVTLHPAALATDWRQFRGPDQTGSAALGSAAEWPDSPALDVVWKVDLGSGYSSLAVTGGVVYTGYADTETDWLGAFDGDTGDRKWTAELGPRYDGHDGSHAGPIATPAVATIGDRTLVFAMGGHGRLVAASADGDVAWSVELSEMGNAPFYGFSASPLVVQQGGKAVLVKEVASGEGPTVVGFDPLNGDVLWQQGDDEVHYQSPVLTTLGGVEQVVAAGMKNLYGLDPFSGEVLWTHEYGEEPRAMGPASTVPLNLGGGRLLVKPGARSSTTVAVSRGEDGWSVEPAWTSQDLSLSYVPAVHHDGHVFGYKRGFLVAVDAASGETVWRSRPPGDGFLAMADGHLVVATKKGSLHLAAAHPDGWKELASLDLFDDSDKNNDVWSDPVVAGGDIYVRSMSELARVAVRPASEDVGTRTADAGRGLEPPEGVFTRLLTSLELYADTPADKASAVDAFVAEQKKTGGFPIVNDGHVIFVFRTAESNAGIEGAMLGERTQGEMRQAAETDLYYFVSALPPDAWVQYRFVPGFGDPVVDPLNEKQTQVMGRGGPEAFSYVTMPDWRQPAYLASEPTSAGRVEHHDLPLPKPETAEEPQGTEDQVDESWPTSRPIDVYLPHDYDEDRADAYPVVFVHSAHMLRDGLQLDRALDHYLGHALPNAVVVMVGPHDPRPGFDMFRSAEAATESFFEQVVPLVDETYNVAKDPAGRSYFAMSQPAGQAIALSLDARSRAGRVVAIQPIYFSSDRQGAAEAAGAKEDGRAAYYVETSPLTLRAEHEGWNVGDEAHLLVEAMRDHGYEVVTGTSNLPMAMEALQGRVGPALAFALTGTAEMP